MKRHLCASLLCLISISSADAIVIRHDAQETAYLADASQFPFLFPLYRSKEGYGDCIATLIAPRWAVTAGHCTEDKPFTEGISKGGYKVEIDGRPAIIDRVERHPPREGGRGVDLALLRFKQRVEHVRPIQVYRNTDEVGREVLLPGWGTPGNGRDGLGKDDGKFRIAENRVDRAYDGILTWVFDSPTSGRALGLEGVNGPGDSGGPALIMTPKGWATIGVSSGQRTFGRPEGLYGAEESYIRLSDYAEWIDQLTYKQ